MPIQITMPRLSDTMEEGTLVKWRVKVGDKVASGDVLADVETDKATMELQSFDDGTVARLAVQENQPAKVGALILVLAAPGESAEEAAKGGDGAAGTKEGKGKTSSPAAGPRGEESPATGQPESEQRQRSSPPATAAPPAPAEPAGRIRVSPLARKIAEAQGVNLASLKGSGPDGRIVKRDVLAAAPAPGSTSAPGSAAGGTGAGSPSPRTASAEGASGGTSGGGKLEAKLLPLSNMRKTIARRLVESKTTIPHFTVTVTTDVGELMRVRAAVNKRLEREGVKLSVNDFIIRATALAVLEHPWVNASWTEGGIQLHGTVNLGVAVSLPAEKGGGLVVPVIRDAQNKDLRTISAEARALADKARTKGLSPEDMAGGTLTISNLGMLGVDHFEAIINPPQAAILAIGAAAEQAVVVNGQVAAGWRMSLTISADHRVVDGSMAAQYVNSVKDMLETPAALLI